MEFGIIKLICFSFGFVIMLLLIYIILTAVSFINFIASEKKNGF